MATGICSGKFLWGKGTHVRTTHKNLLIFASVLIADRLSKWLALYLLGNEPWSVFSGFNLFICWNRGVSWSLFSSDSAFGFWVLTSLIGVIICFFSAYVLQRAFYRCSITWEMLVLGGAVSNFIDRLWHGAVLDFIELYVGQFYWPVFNIADACVVIGIFGILIRSWWCDHECSV